RYSIVTLGTETDLDIELKHQATGERLVTADKNAIGISGLVYLGHSTARLFAQQKSLHTTSSMLAKFESPVPAQTFISATHLNPLGRVEEVMKPVSTGTDNVHLEFPSWSIQSFSYDAANKTFNLSVSNGAAANSAALTIQYLNEDELSQLVHHITFAPDQTQVRIPELPESHQELIESAKSIRATLKVQKIGEYPDFDAYSKAQLLATDEELSAFRKVMSTIQIAL